MNTKSLELNRRPSSSREERVSSRPDERRSAGLVALGLLHEIRTPLEVLGYLIYLAEQQARDPEQVRRYLKLAERHMATLSRIAGQTLHFAELSEGPKPIDLVDLADSALLLHQQMIESKQIHLVKDLPRGLVAGVHRSQMLHVISNLIELVVANTIPLSEAAQRVDKIKTLSIAGLLGRAIESIHMETSVSTLFT